MSNPEVNSGNGEIPELDPPLNPLLRKERPVIEKGLVHKNPDGSIAFITVPTSRRKPIRIGKGENLKKETMRLEGFFKALGIETEE